ncbi:MAG: NAD(P)/FAD-dependent oxidoreductase [Eubacterium sp.]|nr:NAD(P)/FAD-dependent oxidoreductase [Eubacterium sp.]
MRVLVVGGGPAGMMAAIQAARQGESVTLLEQNEKLGKKLFITGKGRCNITNDCDVTELFDSVVSNKKFLYSAFYSFSNQDTKDFFEEQGLRLKVERGRRVFPASDKSSDVIKALDGALKKLGVDVRLFTRVDTVLTEDGRACGVRLADGESILADKVILATGGVSYRSTGSDGSGLAMAEKLGHQVTRLRPGLVGMCTKEDWVRDMQGLTLKNVAVSVGKKQGKKPLYEDFGELLFTHYGVSGPMILSASSRLGDELEKGELYLKIDLKPALSKEQLDSRILRDFEEHKNADLSNGMIHLLPKSMIPVMLQVCGLDPAKKINEVTRAERESLVKGMKEFPATINGLRDIQEAIITRGGVTVKEVDPSTMESKIVKNLYLAGEMLDLDALTGGYNLQIAWSTGYLAGQ